MDTLTAEGLLKGDDQHDCRHDDGRDTYEHAELGPRLVHLGRGGHRQDDHCSPDGHH